MAEKGALPREYKGASEPVWALVCGLRNAKRRTRTLVILNGFVDESEDLSVFVLAGYVASAEVWAAFSDDWHVALHATPGIWELKTKDAMALKGCFSGFTKAERDKKLCDLYQVIDKHVFFEVSAVIPMEPFTRIFRNGILPKKVASPYYHALPLLISNIARHQITIGMEEKIDFIFDERRIEQGKLLAIWDMVVETAPDDVKPMLGSTPNFKSDTDVLPLQAADMEAWWLRKRWRELLTGEPRLEYPWQPAAIPGVTCEYTEEKLQESYGKIFQAHLDAGWRPNPSSSA